MTTRKLFTTLAGASALALVHGTAMAQTADVSAAAPAATAEDTASQVEFLQAQVEAMQAQLDALKKQAAENAPNYRAAPQFGNKVQDPRYPNDPSKTLPGFTFKVRGRLHYDTGFVSNPEDRVNTKNLGFNSRFRRVRLGAQGTFPGGFGYTVEADFANNSVALTDAFLTYNAPDSPFTFTLGQHYPHQGLDQITSSNFVTTLERAQFTDAFGYSRRLGASVNFVSGNFRLDAGIFGDTVNAGLDNDDWQAAVRAVYSQEAFGGRIHLGANYQYRQFQSNTQNFQYRARPGSQLTDIRFVDTGTLAADGDQIFGVEAAGIFGPLHFAAEAQYNKVNTYNRTATFTNGDAAVVGGSGTSTLFPDQDPDFFGAYAEIGYFLTSGDTRGYSAGRFDRVRPKNGFDKGGIGAVQINGRVDYIDLKDRVGGGISRTSNAVTTANVATGAVTTANVTSTSTSPSSIVAGVLNGGEQWLYSANLIWTPIDYIRFVLQYSHAEVKGGPRATTIVPASTERATERSYGVDVVAFRAQFDF